MSIKIFTQNKKIVSVYDKENKKIGDATVEEDILIGIIESWEKVDVSNRILKDKVTA